MPLLMASSWTAFMSSSQGQVKSGSRSGAIGAENREAMRPEVIVIFSLLAVAPHRERRSAQTLSSPEMCPMVY